MRSMTIDKDGDSIVVVFLDGRISDEVRIMEIGDDLTKIASKIAAGQALILDFQNVEYFSSAMVGQIAQIRKTTEKNGAEMRLRNISPLIQAILQAMHLDGIFHVENPDG
ncbi:MAG: STAS domain-containing protein [Planctomycetota bacterium]|nr:STAS domain-containing protein [Planctomycetota bacterium]